MKSYALILLALVRLSAQKSKGAADVFVVFDQIIKDNEHNCMELSEVDPLVLKAATHDAIFTKDPKLMHFCNCIQFNMGVIDRAGNVHEDVLRTYLEMAPMSDGMREKILQKCKGLRGDTAHETSFKVAKCVYTSVKELMVNTSEEV